MKRQPEKLRDQNEKLRKIRQQLEAAVHKYTDLYDFAPVGFLTLSEDLFVREANLTAAAMLGLERGALLTQPFGRFVSNRDRAVFEEMARLAFAAPDSRSINIRLYGLRGRFLAQLQILAHGMDKKRLRVAITDITELGKTQQALRESEQLYRGLFSSMTEGFALHEIIPGPAGIARDYRFLDVNPAFERLTGLKREDIVGKTCKEALPGDDPFWARIYGEVAHRGTPVRFEDRWEKLDRDYEIFAYRPAVDQFAVIFLDVSERKQFERRLQASQADLKRAQAVARTGSWHLDMARNEIRWSDETHRIFGLPKGTPVSYQTFLECVHPADRESVNQRWQAALRGEPYDIEHRIIVDGHVKWVRERAELERGEDSEVIGGFGTTQEITELVQARGAVETSLKRLEMLALAASELLRSKEPQEVVKSLCLQVMEHIGCQVFFNFMIDSQNGCLRLNSCAGIPAEDARKIERLDLGKVVCGGDVQGGNRIIAEPVVTSPDVLTDLLKSSGIRAFTCHPILDSNRNVIGTLSFGTRSREAFSPDELSFLKAMADQVAVAMIRHQAEKDLLSSHARLETMVEERTLQLTDTVRALENEIDERNKAQVRLQQLSRVFMDASDPIVIEDLTGRIVEINREAERAYGWSREELIGKTITEIIPPGRQENAEMLRSICRRGKEVRDWEGMRVHRSGEIIHVLLAAFPLLNESGEVAAVATMAKDITARKKMEESLRESRERLHEISRRTVQALETDRQSVSRELHDHIGGNLAALKFTLEESLDQAPENSPAAATLAKGIEFLSQTIKESKRVSANLRPLALDDLGFMTTLRAFIKQFGEHYKNIKIDYRVDVREEDVSEEHQIMLYRILQESLTNVARHSHADSARVSLIKAAGALVLEVEDNGDGFEPQTAMSQEDPLSGLGLKSMRERVEICRGRFQLESAAGRGTLLRITLPAEPA